MKNTALYTQVTVGLGSNQGDRLGNLREARGLVAQLSNVWLVSGSPVYETEPVDVPEAYNEMWYLNAVLLLQVKGWNPESLLDSLHSIEEKMGRVRGPQRNTPRPIDLDLLTFGNEIRCGPDIFLPHPQIIRRLFVCRPLADLCPDMLLPGSDMNMTELLKTLPETPVVRLSAEQW